MCGIVGYIGEKNVVPVLLDGLRRLEYRGYDSAGVAVVHDGQLEVRRAAGKLRDLEEVLEQHPLAGHFGIGHTRWATHGRPTEENAHPHRDCSRQLVVVHNGIIENFVPLKQRLAAEGHQIVTETDTELICHLVESYYEGDLEAAVRKALPEIDGVYAMAVIHASEPGKIVAARLGPPLVVGLGDSEFFVASDVPAILHHTRDMIFLDDREMAVVTADGIRLVGPDGDERERAPQRITWDPIMAEKGGYKHFMLKEIHEQPRAVRDTLLGRVSQETGQIFLDEMNLPDEEFRNIRRLNLVACGTSWHAGLVGKFMIEKLARVHVEVDFGSEFRYRDPIVDDGTMTLVISQSGETADTLAAMREVKSKGRPSLAICNVVGSMVTREAAGVIYTHAGPEIGVASTKAFTCQLIALYLFALYLAERRGTLEPSAARPYVDALTHLPAQIEELLGLDAQIEEMSKDYYQASNFLFLGRGINYPIALEGALKLKEISYIHAEGYPAGEMKHGPIALIDADMPVVALAVRDHVFDKMLSNMEEVKARDGRLIAVTDDPDAGIEADHVLTIPRTLDLLNPLLLVIPLQMLSYHIALRRGCDVDQPRNLAKSVTVE